MSRIAGGCGISGWVLLLLVAAFAWRAVSVGAAEAEPRGRVVIVADEPKPMQVLAEFLKTQGGYEVQIVDPKDMPPDLSPCCAVFQYIHGPMTDATGKALIEYARKGGRLVLLHHAIASARTNNPEFLRFVGIAISPRTDPKTPWRVLSKVTFTLVNLQPQHYITSHHVTYPGTVEYRSPDAASVAGKFPAIDLADTEAFLNQQFTDGRAKTVLFGLRVTESAAGAAVMQDRGGWLKPAGKGWIFYFQPGHTEADFRNRNYAQVVLNCLTWKPPAEPSPEAKKP